MGEIIGRFLGLPQLFYAPLLGFRVSRHAGMRSGSYGVGLRRTHKNGVCLRLLRGIGKGCDAQNSVGEGDIELLEDFHESLRRLISLEEKVRGGAKFGGV